ERGAMIPGSAVTKSVYGLMPGDYTYRSFKIADSVFPKSVKLNINDYNLSDDYLKQVLDLKKRGCKIDIMGAQMHLFNPQACLDIADGITDVQSPNMVNETFERLGKAGLPIHLSEITITAPNNDERGQAIQAVITRNLYRLWFSIKPMMGITWWNVVDDCGAPGEPSVSGLFTRNMEPKPVYHVLDDLINHEWKTRCEVKAGKDGAVEFRGFRGTYRLTWKDKNGKTCSTEAVLN
ncbi:MAG: endo-1,4-beta-xylanase, partial [Lentisphaeria bacterium]|nr:endo-1,4-beta-xylanase [Lentisphaeria bacterium]